MFSFAELKFFTRQEANRSRPSEQNEYEYFLRQLSAKTERLREAEKAAGVTSQSITPPWIRAMDALLLLQLPRDKQLAFQAELDDSIKKDVTKFTLAEVQRVVRKLFVPNKRLQTLYGSQTRGQPQPGYYHGEDQHDENREEHW